MKNKDWSGFFGHIPPNEMNLELFGLNKKLCDKVGIPEGKGYRVLLDLYLQFLYVEGFICDEDVKEYLEEAKANTKGEKDE